MDSEMKEVINLLEQMGATDVEFIEVDGSDDVLTFTYGDRVVTLYGMHYNDSTGGIGATIEPSS